MALPSAYFGPPAGTVALSSSNQLQTRMRAVADLNYRAGCRGARRSRSCIQFSTTSRRAGVPASAVEVTMMKRPSAATSYEGIPGVGEPRSKSPSNNSEGWPIVSTPFVRTGTA